MLDVTHQDIPEKTDRRERASLSRRSVLASSAIGLFAGSATASADRSKRYRSSEDESEHAPFAADDHDHSGDVLGEGQPVASVLTENLTSEVRRKPSSLQSRKNTLSLPDLADTYTDLGPFSNVSGAQYPTVVKASAFLDEPIDTYYMYAAPYGTPYVSLYTASHPEGPWTEQGEVLRAEPDGWGQADSPHAMYVPEHDELWLYYHEAGGSAGYGPGPTGQYTMLARTSASGDGTSFTKYGDPTPVLAGRKRGRWDDYTRTYFTCRRVGSKWFGVYQGLDHGFNERGIGVAYSQDGIDWRTQQNPIGWGTIIQDYDPNEANLVAPTLVQLGQQLFVLYSDRTADDPSTVWAFGFNQRENYVTAEDATPLFTVDPTTDWRKLACGDTLNVGSKTYFFYQNGVGYVDWGEYL